MRILLVEDDRATALTLKSQLKDYYIVEVAFSGRSGQIKAQSNEYDAIILDYVLPKISGLEICEKLRANGDKTPILILTGQSETEKKVMALDSGADDYLTKPFSLEELLARLRALLRRGNGKTLSKLLTVGDLSLDMNTRTVTRQERLIRLRPKELYLLEYLMHNAGRTLTRNMIANHIWDSSHESITNIVDVHIKYLRDKIDKSFQRKLIKTAPGFGYRIDNKRRGVRKKHEIDHKKVTNKQKSKKGHS